MRKQTSPQEHINKLNEFRQAIYAQGFKKRRDAQFELLDALLMSAKVGAFPELTLSLVFRRRWSSGYKAIEEGTQDRVWMTRYLSRQIPEAKVQVFALDETVWAHPQARTLEEMLYERSPTKSIKRYSIVRGHPYSILAWIPDAGGSWAPPVDSRRVTAEVDVVDTGLQQIKAMLEARQRAGFRSLHVIATDGKYSNHRFKRGLAGCKGVASVGRTRCDRRLHRKPGPYKGRGRKDRKHGPAFAFKDPLTWGLPCEVVCFEHRKFGQVRLRRWDDLHDRQDAVVEFSVIRCEVHLARELPPDPIWLEDLGPSGYDAHTIWSWFQQRWAIEPANRFRKQALNWTLPRFQQTERCDRWTNLIDLAYWQLFLARHWVRDWPLPWQAPLANPTPERVLQSLGVHFTQLISPAQAPVTRGIPPGWPKGRPRDPPKRYETIRRSQKSA
jgi:hypothetical protein